MQTRRRLEPQTSKGPKERRSPRRPPERRRREPWRNQIAATMQKHHGAAATSQAPPAAGRPRARHTPVENRPKFGQQLKNRAWLGTSGNMLRPSGGQHPQAKPKPRTKLSQLLNIAEHRDQRSNQSQSNPPIKWPKKGQQTGMADITFAEPPPAVRGAEQQATQYQIHSWMNRPPTTHPWMLISEPTPTFLHETRAHKVNTGIRCLFLPEYSSKTL